MSYLEIYKKRMGGTKKQAHDKRHEFAKHIANKNFVLAEGYFPAILSERGKEPVEIDVAIRSGTSELQKYILFRPDTRIETGSYVHYNDKTYIVKEVNVDLTVPKGDCYLCNQALNFRGVDFAIPCYTNSTTYGSKGILDQDKFYELDSKTKIYIQRNAITESLKIGQRIMFANQYVYRITELDDLVYPNMFTAVAQKDETVPMDDFKNNLAWNAYEEPVVNVASSEIVGDEKFKLHESCVYTIDKPVTWEIDDLDIVDIIDSTETSVELRGVKRGWVTLIARDAEGQSYEKEIMVC